MSKTIFETLKEAEEDLKKIQKIFPKELAEQAKNDMVDAHHQIISNFYEHENSYYDRYGELENTLYTCSSSRGKARIVVSPQRMDDHYERSNKYDVFDLMWNKGVRGLPRVGIKPLSHSFEWVTPTGTRFWEAGEKWINPFWSGTSKPYENIFLTSININGYKSNAKRVPHMAMVDFINHWGEFCGDRTCSKIKKEFK